MSWDRTTYATSPQELGRGVIDLIDWNEELRTGIAWHPRFWEVINEAWANHWRLAKWLVACSCLGVEVPEFRDNAVGLFIHQMMLTAEEESPDDPEDWPTLAWAKGIQS